MLKHALAFCRIVYCLCKTSNNTFRIQKHIDNDLKPKNVWENSMNWEFFFKAKWTCSKTLNDNEYSRDYCWISRDFNLLRGVHCVLKWLCYFGGFFVYWAGVHYEGSVHILLRAQHKICKWNMISKEIR